MSDKILILKNDRAGDLFTSLTLISSLIHRYKNIKIYLSELNSGFSFFFKGKKINKVNFNLSLSDKFSIFYDILVNDYKKIYILTPKSFYFILPFIFRNIKFYAIVYDGFDRSRPSNYLRNYLFKYKVIYRNKINKKSYRQLQNDLLDDDIDLDTQHNALFVPKITKSLKNLLPNKYILFQFRYLFFEQLGWGIDEFDYLISQLSKKYKYILFSSDIENNNKIKKYNEYFINHYSVIDLTIQTKNQNLKNPNIYYLKNINSENLFYVLNESTMNLGKEGLYSHISFFLKKKCHNLFNFKILKKEDIIHEKISYSEWCKDMQFGFSFLNSDIKKATRKIIRNI